MFLIRDLPTRVQSFFKGIHASGRIVAAEAMFYHSLDTKNGVWQSRLIGYGTGCGEGLQALSSQLWVRSRLAGSQRCWDAQKTWLLSCDVSTETVQESLDCAGRVCTGTQALHCLEGHALAAVTPLLL